MVTKAAGFVMYRIYQEKIEYLLLQASYGIKHWTPPKGHVDPGENDYETALRETKEEAGLSESDLLIYKDICKTIGYDVKRKPKSVVYWLAKVKDPLTKITLSHEHIDYKWVQIEEALRLCSFKEFNEVLMAFHEDILKLQS